MHEIEARLRRRVSVDDAQHVEVSTIHSFCLNHIFRSRCHEFAEYKDGFILITQDSDEYRSLVEATCGHFGLAFNSQAIEMFASLQIGADGEAAGNAISAEDLTAEQAAHFWTMMRNAGQIDFAGLLYLSLQLIRRHSGIADHLASRFSWFVVDEFQDTTNIQVDIFREIFRRGRSKFFLVGDPYQSIFGFAGAEPKTADEFAVEIGARTDFQLTGNFRSTPAIVQDAETIFDRVPPMSSVGPLRFSRIQTEYVNAGSTLEAVTDRFLPRLKALEIELGDAAILAPTWFTLYPLGRALRDEGVAIVGPGARPYRRSHLFAVLAERICGFVVEPDPEDLPGIERALFDVLLQVTGERTFRVFTYDGRRAVYRLLEVGRLAAEQSHTALPWLRSTSESVGEILCAAGFLKAHEARLLRASVDDMERDMRGNRGVDMGVLTIEDLGLYSKSKGALKLLSLHASKGREFDAVLLVDLHEGKIPFFRATTEEDFLAARRLFYVGITRARKFLMYSTDDSHWRNTPTRYLGSEFLNLS